MNLRIPSLGNGYWKGWNNLQQLLQLDSQRGDDDLWDEKLTAGWVECSLSDMHQLFMPQITTFAILRKCYEQQNIAISGKCLFLQQELITIDYDISTNGLRA